MFVALAWLLTEDRQPPVSHCDGRLVSSRPFEYTLHARGLAASCGEAACRTDRTTEADPVIPAPVLDALPGPQPLRTIDRLHLASCAYLVDQGQEVELESSDRRMNEIARELGFPLFDPKGP